MKKYNSYSYPLISALILLTITACDLTEQISPDNITLCTDPRAEVCTQNYLPVCGTEDPTIPSGWTTFSNACTACAVTTISAYKQEACENN